MIAAGIHSLAVALPESIRTNDYWCERYPEVAEAQRKWQQHSTTESPMYSGDRKKEKFLFDALMAQYVNDPFTGAVERRVLKAGEKTQSLALKAVRQVLDVASIPLSEIDLLISNSMFPDWMAGGDGAQIANELEGYHGGALNIDSTCAGSLSALLTASAFVQSGQARHVLVVSACNFSRAIEETQHASRITGDAAGAFIVGPVEPGYGLLGAKSLHTGETSGKWYVEAVPDPTGSMRGGSKVRQVVTHTTMHILRNVAGRYLRGCTEGALQSANLKLDEIKFFIFHSYFAWATDFAVEVLGIDPNKTINTFPCYANIGPATMPVNLHHAASLGKIKPGDPVLLYLFGGEAQAVAAVIRWGETSLGHMPEGHFFI